MEEAACQGGGGAEEAEGEAGQAEGDPRRAGEETRPTEERGRGAVKERGGREEGKGGGGEEEEAGGGREEEAGHDAGPEGEAVRWRQEGRRQEDRRRRECLLDICLTEHKQQFFQGMGNVQDARREMTKTKEQLEEEKKISLSIRIKPLELDGMDGDALKEKASELWEVSIQM